MDINKKFMFVFLLLCVIGMFILYNLTAIPDYGIRKQDFKLDDIQKIVVTKYPEEKEITLTDSAQIVPIIESILKAKEINIFNAKTYPTKYFMEFKFKNGKKASFFCHEKTSKDHFFNYINTYYNSDSLFLLIDTSFI